MMRYQRVSPDCLPLSNGKKPSLRTATTSASKEDNCNNNIDNGRTIPNGGGFNGTSTSTSTCTSYDAGAKGLRFRSPSRNQDLHVNNHHLSHSGASCAPASPSPTSENNHHYSSQSQRRDTSPSPSPSPNRGDVLLQWGHKKRSRVSRTEIRSATVIITDDSSSSSVQGRQPINKLQRRALSATMPPPPLPPPHPSSASSNNNSSRASNLRNGVFTGSETSGFISSRTLEEKSAATIGSPSRNGGTNGRVISRSAAGKRTCASPDKATKKTSCSGSTKDAKQNGSIGQSDRMKQSDSALVQSEQEAGVSTIASVAGPEKVNIETMEWPRIYIALSRKEKEDDFLAMKGTKLPHRPKKRAKNVDKALQYCFPGMWLSDLTKSRYEVREKKCVKKVMPLFLIISGGPSLLNSFNF
ncbi:putative uncharacterized protein DDB_G0285869 isoform X1 [Carica papaya]|uniref:putative uncharacterized protein DDB_G0285869 isoform X1 n=1 Tax=Carica papaya TaxID=3649 RepID=UPI000B8CB8F8|nr:putative uncharacterized protein DDB_G0285869 isoform X1 [Carica papaya]